MYIKQQWVWLFKHWVWFYKTGCGLEIFRRLCRPSPDPPTYNCWSHLCNHKCSTNANFAPCLTITLRSYLLWAVVHAQLTSSHAQTTQISGFQSISPNLQLMLELFLSEDSCRQILLCTLNATFPLLQICFHHLQALL